MKNLFLIILLSALSFNVFSQWHSNLGIGIDTPMYKLDVDGDINISTGHSFLIDGNPIALDKNIWQTNSNDAYYNQGKIGIGTNDPKIKLHIKDSTSQLYFGYQPGYDGPYINLLGEVAGQTSMFGLGLAQKDYNYKGNILCYKDWAYLYGNIYNKGIAIIPDLNQTPAGVFIDVNGSVGVGVDNPHAKLEVADGDIYISDIDKGIIMKSPDGNCWRGVLDNSGQLNFTIIDCPNELALEIAVQTKSSETILVFPNPSENNLTIDLRDNQIENIIYEINSINGRLIGNGKLMSRIQTLDISKFDSGIYLLNIYGENGIKLITEKIIKE